MTRVRHALTQAWNNQGGWGGQLLTFMLLPISWGFGGLVKIRRQLYWHGLLKQHTLPVPVIVVGNVMVGGVGKTPVTMALVQHLKNKGMHVGVLSRGYGRNTANTPSIQAVTQKSTAQDVGDEPLLIARTCQVPVYVGSNRAAAGQALLAAHPDVNILVCDDGLQHWQLARTLELCVFDERGVGNGHLLPSGPLREPWPRQAVNKHVTPCFLVKTSGQAGPDEFAVQRNLANFAQQANGTQRLLQSWRDMRVQALAGIAKPHVFFDMLRQQGLTLSRTQALPDHADLQEVHIDASQGDVLCTEKDAVKLWEKYPHAWAVPLQTTLPTELLQAIDQHIATAQHAKLSFHHGHKTA